MQIKDAIQIAQSCGLKIESESTVDIIASQMPKPGAKTKYGDEIKVAINGKEAKFSDQKPNLIGKSLRRALAILHSDGYKARIIGSGTVSGQYWQKNSSGDIECVLECKNK